MALIKCPECEKEVSDKAPACPNCGCPINSAAVVAPQNDPAKEIEKLLVLAHRAKEASDSKNAKKYYDQILDKDPGNWEAIFYTVYFEASECTIGNIGSAANSVANSIYSTFAAIGDLENKDEQDAAINTIIDSAFTISIMFVSGAVSHYNQFPTVSGAFSSCSSKVVSAGNIYAEIETSLKKFFADRTTRIADFQKSYALFLKTNKRWYNTNYFSTTIGRLNNEIKTVYPDYQTETTTTTNTTTNTSGGCYVATAVYGSYDCPQVWTLRRFRDNTLAETWYGRAFIRTYYAISPTLVKWFGKTEWFKNLWKPTLDRMVEKLNENGVEDTAYNDRPW